MREYFPFILIGLALFCVACVAVVASELLREAEREGENDERDAKAD